MTEADVPIYVVITECQKASFVSVLTFVPTLLIAKVTAEQ